MSCDFDWFTNRSGDVISALPWRDPTEDDNLALVVAARPGHGKGVEVLWAWGGLDGEGGDAMIGVGVVLADLERPFAITGIVDAAGGHVAALGPVLEIGSGAHPGFEEGAIPVRAIAAAHENGVAHAFAADVAFHLLTRGGEAFGKRQKQMRRSRAGHGGAGVEVLEGHAHGVFIRHAVATAQNVRGAHA